MTLELRTPRLLLRRARAEDLAPLHAVLSDPEATRYWSTPPHESLEQTRAWLEAMMASPPAVSEDFVVVLEDQVIGKAGFFRLPEIGYILHPKHWGRGYAFEALAAVIDHVWTAHGVSALTAEVDPGNAASRRLLAKLRFREVGRAERTLFIAGAWHDSIYLRLER